MFYGVEPEHGQRRNVWLVFHWRDNLGWLFMMKAQHGLVGILTGERVSLSMGLGVFLYCWTRFSEMQ